MSDTEQILMGEYFNPGNNFTKFDELFKDRENLCFWYITTDKKTSGEIFDYVKKFFDTLQSIKVLIIDEIDKQWPTFNHLLQAMLIVQSKMKHLSMESFSYEFKDGMEFFIVVFGTTPLPSNEEVFEEIRKQLKKNGEISHELR